jgi:hypothetical protein
MVYVVLLLCFEPSTVHHHLAFVLCTETLVWGVCRTVYLCVLVVLVKAQSSMPSVSPVSPGKRNARLDTGLAVSVTSISMMLIRHFLLHCPALVSARRPEIENIQYIFRENKATLAWCVVAGDDELFVQMILDAISLF